MTELVFSISIPAGPKFDPRLKRALKSLSQQGVALRIGVCDVSDAQDCKNALLSYSEIIKYVRHGPDRGQSAAINEGWRNVDGDIYGWLNVDDYLAPGALKEVEKAFEMNPDVDVVFGQSYITRSGRIIGLHNEVRPMNDDIYCSNIVSQPSCFIRRTVLFKIGLLSDDLEYTMDWDLWIKLYQSGAKFYYLPSVLSVVEWDMETKTASLSIARYREIIKLRRRYSGWKSSYRTAFSFLLEHLSQYGIFKSIFQVLINMIKKRNGQPLQKWLLCSKDGHTNTDATTLTLPIFHYDANPAKKLQLKFGTPGKRKCQTEDTRPVFSEGKEVEIPVSILPGERYLLRIDDYAASNIALRSVLLCV